MQATNTESRMQTLLKKVGAQNRYQIILFLNFALKWMLAGMVLFSLNFFYFVPDYDCSEGGTHGFNTCQNYVCSLIPQTEWVNHLKKPVPASIAIDFETIMLCDNEWMISLLQSMSYLGSLIGFLLMPHLADNLGRKQAERIAWVLSIFGQIILGISFNLYMVGFGSFLMGFGSNAAITLHYSFLKQLVSGNTRSRMPIALQIAFSVGVSIISLLCMLFYTWRTVLFIFILVPSIVALVWGEIIIEETPTFSLRKGRETLLESMNKIARMNNNDQIQMEDLNQILDAQSSDSNNSQPQKTYKFSFLDLFRFKSIRNIAIICAAIDCIIEFVYDATILSLGKIGVSVYLDQILVGFVEIFAALYSSIVIVKVRRKRFCIIALVIMTVCLVLIGVLSYFTSKEDDIITAAQIIQMAILAVMRFCISSLWGVFFVFIVELFPASVTSLSFGWVSAVGTLGATISPFIRLESAAFTMFLMAGLSALAIVFMNLLEETKGKPIRAQIQQLVDPQQQIKPATVISAED